MKKRSWILISIQAFGLFCVSFFSQYQLPDYQRMNFSIAAMMTPGGLFHNLWFDSFSSLKVYYFLEPSGNIEFTNFRLLILLILFFGMIASTWMYYHLLHKSTPSETSL